MKTKDVEKIIDDAIKFGLPHKDTLFARECLEHNEFGVCLDTIATQLYEYDVKVDESFIKRFYELCKQIELSDADYSYLLELVNQDG